MTDKAENIATAARKVSNEKTALLREVVVERLKDKTQADREQVEVWKSST